MTHKDVTGGEAPVAAPREGWFPGRGIGGAALVLGPLLWAAGLLLRYLGLRSAGFTPAELEWFGRQPFAVHSQVAAYVENPGTVTAGYACFAAGALLLCPAFVTLARTVALRCPRLAAWGGTLLVIALFARLYHAGVEQAAFDLAEAQGLRRAVDFVLSSYADISYGPWRVPVTASACQYPGMVLLAIGAFRSGTFGLARCVALVMAGALWGGVLKAAEVSDVVWAAGLCLALVPLGVRLLRGTAPEPRGGSSRLLSW
ncbi:hypothetical protein ABGB17_26435 [Sphaerisporangium sp. B11E5]|uniref:hypothetical protein n=1 Tax=Sphaerisporangium sp. B11E5 TaxID=3153563 RepID=UPI00325D93F6